MPSTLKRTSMALDQATCETLDELSQAWKVSKAEVVRRSLRSLHREVLEEDLNPSPAVALRRLQASGCNDAEAQKILVELKLERQALSQWWER